MKQKNGSVEMATVKMKPYHFACDLCGLPLQSQSKMSRDNVMQKHLDAQHKDLLIILKRIDEQVDALKAIVFEHIIQSQLVMEREPKDLIGNETKQKGGAA